ncbi:unnamed protein product [Lathyrus sativus]|nr:unnamed protein product [Lathyrus sativus]
MSVENEPSSDKDTIDFGFVERSREKVVDMGLSDSYYITEDLESDEDSSNDYSDEGTKKKYLSCFMPKKFLDYKRVLGTMFSTKEEFKEEIANYGVNNGRDLHFIKNDKTRVRVGCKEGCE